MYQPTSATLMRYRQRQHEGILDQLRDERLPVILAGDFNATPTSPSTASLTALGFTDAYDLGGYGPGHTWPNRTFAKFLPGIRIDHVYLSEGPTCTASHVGEPIGSDHRPVIADIGIINISQ